jgi:D-glycero-alpha-D-manno-heptose-7-phosphate kinase
MIIVQAPLRVSLFGGGTDFPEYYKENGGCVLSTAIDKYIFVTIKKRFDRKLRIGYTKTEMVDDLSEINHELIREALRKTTITSGVEVTTMGDIPSEGSGLGSSSTVTVGSLQAMYTLQGELVSAERLAREACEIEIDVLGKPIGVQDQYIAAYGGLRFIEFPRNGPISSHRLHLPKDLIRALNDELLLFFTGVTRSSATILTEQKSNIEDRTQVLSSMKQIAQNARDELLKGNVDSIGECLHESWYLKRQLASRISNGYLDDIYQVAREAGAVGGKITGAGGGGFILLYCPYQKHKNLRSALSKLQELPFKLEHDGSKVIFNYQR